MKTLSQNQIKSLDYWKMLSRKIAKLYNQLELIELSFGKESTAYKDTLEMIRICLEVEDDLEDEFYFIVDSDINRLVTSYLRSESRILKRLARNIRANDFYLDILRDSEFGSNNEAIYVGLMEDFEKNSERRIRDKKVSLIEDSIFLNLVDKELLILLLQEIEKANDCREKLELIKVRDLLLNRNKSLEQWYLGMLVDPTFELIDGDEFVAEQLGISLNKYRLDKRIFLRDEVRSIQDSILCKRDGYFKRNSGAKIFAQLYLKCLFSLLELSDIELEYEQFKYSVGNKIDFSSDNVQFIFSLYDNFLREFKSSSKSKKPNGFDC